MNDRNWYVVQTYSGLESVAKENIIRRVKSMNMENVIFNVLVPEIKEMVKDKKGNLKETITKPYSGYVFIDMIQTDEAWFMVRNTPMVTGFLGSSGGGAKPVPLQEDEIAPILKMCGISLLKNFAGKVGDKVKITAGSFTGQEGIIDEIDTQREVVKVLVDCFGRQTPAELNFNEVVIL